MPVNRPQQIKVTFIDPTIAAPEAFTTHISRRGRVVAMGLLIAVVALAAYAPALRGQFAYFDDQIIANNPALRSWWDGLRAIWIHPTIMPHYQPLAYSALLAEFKLFTTKLPGGYLAISALLHAANALLLWTLLRRLELPGALAAAVLFAVHPINVEAVAWMSQQPLLLGSAFGLCALLAYLRYCGINPAPQEVVPGILRLPERRSLLYALSIILFLSALTSHAATASLPLVILVLIWWERGRLTRRDVLPVLPLVLIGVIWMALVLHADARRGAAMNDLLQTPLTTRALVAARSVWISLAHLVSPARLSFAYPKWKPGMIDVVAVAAIPIVLVGTWAARAKVGRGAFAGCVLFLVLLVPFFVLRTDLDQYAYLADHLSYLAAMVFVAAVTSTFAAVLARRQSPTWKWPALLLAAAAASLLLVLTELRLPDYRNAEGVWRAALRRDPASAIANNHLGLIELNDRRDGAAAMEYFRAALRSDPGNTQTHEHIAGTYEFLHDYGKARDEYLQVLARSENDAEAHSGLARCLAALGHSDEAMREYEVVLKLAPNDVVALNNIGLLHDERGELDQAQAAFERAIKINPGYSPAYLNLGNLLYKEGKIEAGIAILARLLQIDRVNFRAYFNAGAWAAALASREEMAHDERVRLNEQAEILMTTAVQLRPGSSEAYFSLGKILLQKNTLTGRSDYGLAISFLERAVELDPENQGARQILQRARDEQTRSNPPSHR